MAIISCNWGEQEVGQQKKIKRDLSLTDKSKDSIVLTLWGDKYHNLNDDKTCVLLHNAVVNEYNGTKTLTSSINSVFIPKPNIKVAEELKTWFDHEIKLIKK